MESAIAAQNCGADRVELCARLDLDGLTPSEDLILKTREAIDIDLHVIIRPREGDFSISEKELQQMIASIAFCKKNGVDGVVLGGLTDDRSLDVEVTQILVDAARPMSVTFHRAFDVCQNPKRVLGQLNDLGIDRLLTSGQAQKAINGIDVISQFVEVAYNQIGIMAGSGVDASNVEQLWNVGVRQFHFSSHKPNETGINVFDSQKTELVLRKLNKLCGI